MDKTHQTDTATLPANSLLWLGTLYLGRISKLLFSDHTWYGVLEPASSLADHVEGQSILDYIRFSIDWHDRLRNDEVNPPNPSEFNHYSSLLESDQWSIVTGTPPESHQVEAPVFLPGLDFSCKPLSRN